MPWTSLRTVVLEKKAQEQHDYFEENLSGFDSAYLALEWLLSRDPYRGRHRDVNGIIYNFYIQGSDPIAQTPEIWVLFKYTDNEVFISAINAQVPTDNE